MKYVIGVDFGSESGRAVIVDVATGRELATCIFSYPHGVINERLPDSDIVLEPDWALQDPNDYIEVFKHTVPAVLRESGVNPQDVIGIGIDFTACTMLPTKQDGTPLCFLPEWRNHPHAWVKLWKHHAAQPEADLINEVARQRGEPWLPLYGGKISSEWFYSKALQVLNEAPEAYQAADRFIEAADWVIWQLIGLGGGSPHQAGLAKVMPLLQHTPAARIARPEQLASVIAFLASLEASNVNGAILPADYGWSAV